jgi:multicomponent Na+:H+ antiporter subunit B
MTPNPILNSITHFVAPFILLLSLYIQINGEVSPGGGFQAGALFASLIIALDLARNFNFHIPSLLTISAIGILIYIAPGIMSLMMKKNFLNYYVLADGILGQKIGIFVIEVGVGMAVASTMSIIYACFWKNDTPDK